MTVSGAVLTTDVSIATTAISLQAPLVTKNQRDYRFVEKLNLLVYPVIIG